jgi:hypothetical protein
MRRRRGANAIEFALCMPVFVLIAAATIDFAWLFYHRSAVDAAVGFGCRDGALVDPLVGYPTTVAEQAVIDALEDNGLPCDAVSCTADASITGTMPNVSLVCGIDITFEPLFGLLSGSQHMHAETVRRLEWQRESSLPPPPEG